MKTLSLSEAKMKLSALVESVVRVDNEIMITKNGKPAAVLISPDAFDSWKETSRIQFDEGLMAEIHEGLAALEKNHAGLYTLEELFQDSEK